MTSECYRQLKTNLQLSEFGDSSRVLFFSSGMPQEGKTSVAVNLGITLAAEEKKVLIVDANFWQPMIYRVFPPEGFEIPKKKSRKNKMPAMDKLTGLSDILTGLDDYSAAVRSTDIENLDVIDSGKPPANPVEILGSSKIKELLDSLRDKYDYILVDGPPVLLVSDAKLLARNVDGTILVFNATSTKRGAALRTIRELKEVNVSIMGSVLFAARALKGGYFQQQFKIYQDYQNPELAKAK
jgi:capsular exopolysaccharide synthesis family protein